MTDEDLLPLQDEQETTGFDVVLRGYDRRQVEDYVERVEVALADADRQHTEDGERLAALEADVLSLQSRLAEAERAAAGLPEPASRLGERMATMLRLAEEEAEQLVAQAQERAAATMSERTADLDRRETEIGSAAEIAAQTRLEAQQDADALRARTQQETQAMQTEARRTADEVLGQARNEAETLTRMAAEHAATKRRTAEEDVQIVHEDARRVAAELLADARAQVEQLSAQRDTIAAQLQALRETLGAAVGPLHPQPLAGELPNHPTD